jgi:hypothetical protein
MCHEFPDTIIPRITALLSDETVAWTGNEIFGRISTGDIPCEKHFDEALHRMIRQGYLACDEDAFSPIQTETGRCRLSYLLSPEAKALSRVVRAPSPSPWSEATPDVATLTPPPVLKLAPPPRAADPVPDPLKKALVSLAIWSIVLAALLAGAWFLLF